MPALVKSNVGSFAGNKGDERTRVCPWRSKYFRNVSRISFPVIQSRGQKSEFRSQFWSLARSVRRHEIGAFLSGAPSGYPRQLFTGTAGVPPATRRRARSLFHTSE